MWLPRADDVFCPQCQGNLNEPPEELDEDEEAEDRAQKRNVFDVAVLVGNTIQFIPIFALLTLFVGGLVYGLVGAVARGKAGSAAVFVLILVVFGGLLYAVVKNFVANTRK